MLHIQDLLFIEVNLTNPVTFWIGFSNSTVSSKFTDITLKRNALICPSQTLSYTYHYKLIAVSVNVLIQYLPLFSLMLPLFNLFPPHDVFYSILT